MKMKETIERMGGSVNFVMTSEINIRTANNINKMKV